MNLLIINFFKVKKQITFLIVAMLFSMASALAQGGTTGPLTWNLNNGTLTIGGNGAMPDYVNPDDVPWYFYRFSIHTAIMEIEVTSIGNNAFFGCLSLTSITIPDNVTTIGKNAFFGCSSLTSITIPDNITTIGNYAFSACSGLASITIPNSVTTIGDGAFHNCTSLTSVTIPNNVTTIGGSAFYNCVSLQTVNYNAINCTTMGSGTYPVFGYCTAFIILDIGNQVETIPNHAFSNCTSLNTITMGNSVTTIGNYAFSSCSSLPSVTIGNSVITIEDGAFSNCTSLNTITMGNSVTTIGNIVFSNCSSLTSVTIGNSVTTIGGSAFSDCSSLNSVTIGNNVTTIGNYAFYGCTGLTSVTIPNNVTTIGNHAFFDCSSLQTVNYNAINCTTMGGYSYPVFKNCTAFTILNIGNQVETIPNYAFFGCSNLTSITIPNNVTTIGDRAFSSCLNLNSITIPNSVKTIGVQTFSYCTSLASIIIPNSVLAIGIFAFGYCSSLASITIPDNVTTIGGSAFQNCTSLQTVNYNAINCTNSYPVFLGCTAFTTLNIGNQVKTISDYAFNNCSSLQTVNYNAINCTTMGIYNAVFSDCTAFTTLNIGNQVETIPNSAFYGCSSLTSITSLAIIPPILSGSTFYGVPKNIPVYVPCGTKPAYQAAAYWSSFTNLVDINSPTAPTSISGNSTVCAGSDSQNYSISPVPNATDYTWKVPSGWIINSGQGSTSISVTPSSNAQSGYISVIANNNCGSSTACTCFIIVYPEVPVTNYSATICYSTSYTDNNFTNLTEAGTYCRTLQSVIGCDSIVCLTLTCYHIIPVINIANLPSTATIGVLLPLTGIVEPDDATNKSIIWSIASAGSTGAIITGNDFFAVSEGTAIVTATITAGANCETDYKQSFFVTVGSSVDIIEATNYPSLWVYPNPTDGKLIIDASTCSLQFKIEYYSILDIMGQLMLAGKLQDEATTINVETLPSGMYFLKIAEKVVKFVKQ